MIHRLFAHRGPEPGAATARRPEAFGRFEGDAANDSWAGGALHRSIVAGRKVPLLAFIGARARLLVGYRWCHTAPEGRGKIEQLFRAVRDQLLVELDGNLPATRSTPRPVLGCVWGS